MRRKAIMVDVDGVLVTHPDAGGWSANLENDLGIPLASLQDGFFRRHWADVVHGRAALRDRLALALAEFAPSVSPAALIEYWFKNDAHIDECLLAELQLLRKAGFELHLATVQEHERAAYLWDRLALKDSFDGMHYAASLGYSKPDHAFYRAVEAAVQIPPAAIFFIDDKIDNVEAARECGWAAALWTGDSTVRELMRAVQWDDR
ncbi:HAD-IA family hydrolase [Sandarakinorhabdus sp.]|uniref:HAD family hydrolase n=1 Tax=Sandarakinorhabdus sp. TaxID=1916663 RepID=UPI0028A82C1E|nr:HAD-IA family hydrolase [Sandarakinorhabdus sp.]